MVFDWTVRLLQCSVATWNRVLLFFDWRSSHVMYLGNLAALWFDSNFQQKQTKSKRTVFLGMSKLIKSLQMGLSVAIASVHCSMTPLDSFISNCSFFEMSLLKRTTGVDQ